MALDVDMNESGDGYDGGLYLERVVLASLKIMFYKYDKIS